VISDALTKAARLNELQLLFWNAPQMILTTAYLASRVGVAERTMRKYITELSASGRLPVYREGRGWRLTEEARLEIPPVSFQLEEAAAVYLAGRLLLQHADEPNPAVRAALSKLAGVVPKELRTPIDRLADRAPHGDEDRFEQIFRQIAYGWVLRRVVHISYAPRSRAGVFEARLLPYLIEPAAVGSAIYVIGRMDPPGERRVLKLERVRAASLTAATFEPPPITELLDELDTAWGVWLTDEAPSEVTLRFTAGAAPRVRETRWHPSQRLETPGDGTVLLTVTVASTVEIVPWILGWGPLCEVLKPAELRERIAVEHRAAASLYG
jgi:predicted DNA-binding transcriptional regulator YafY